jgi:hypothetical protein
MPRGISSEPKPLMVPLRWLIVTLSFSLSIVGSAIYVGVWVNSIDSRLQAAELKTNNFREDLQDASMIRKEIIEKLNVIQNHLSVVEGKLSIIERKVTQ